MRFEIGETDSPLSSPAGTCKFILSGRDIEVAAVLENHVWDGGESIVVVTGDGSSKISYYGTHRYYDHSGESCYKYFIIKFNGKIGGYILTECVNFAVIKAVIFEEWEQIDIKEEQVMSFIEASKQGIDGEKTAGIKIKACDIVYGTSFGGSGESKSAWTIASANTGNKIVFENDKNNQGIEFVCETDGAFVDNGEEKQKATIKPGETVICNSTGKTGEISILVKSGEEYIGFILIKISSVDSINGQSFVPKVICVNEILYKKETAVGWYWHVTDERLVRSFLAGSKRITDDYKEYLHWN